MKKYISILALLLVISPSVALASWWNPFSWGVFHKVDKTEALENRIKELEKKIENKTSTSSEATVEASLISTKIPVKNEVKKNSVASNDILSVKEQVRIQVAAALKVKIEADALIAQKEAEEKAKEQRAYLEKQVTPVVQTGEVVPKFSTARLFDDQAVFKSNVPLDPHSLSIIYPRQWAIEESLHSQNCYKLPPAGMGYCPNWVEVNTLPVVKSVISAQQISENNYLYAVQLTDNISVIASHILESNPSYQRVYKISISIAGGKTITFQEVLVSTSTLINLTF